MMLGEEAEEQEEQQEEGEGGDSPSFPRPTQSDHDTPTAVCWGSAGHSSDLSAPRRSTHLQGRSQKPFLGMQRDTG